MRIHRVLQPGDSQVGRSWGYREALVEALDTQDLSVVSFETRWRAGAARADLVGKLLLHVARGLEGWWGEVGVTVIMRDSRDRLQYRTRPPRSMRMFLPPHVDDALTSWTEVVNNPGTRGVAVFGAGTLDWRRADLRDLGALMLDQTAVGVYFHQPNHCFTLGSLLSRVSRSGSLVVSELVAPVRLAATGSVIFATAYGAFDDEVQAIDLLCDPSIARRFTSASSGR